MTVRGKHWRLSILLILAALGMGCNVLSFPFFLLMGMNSKKDPLFKLASKEKDKEVTVVILASAGLETRPEFLRVDRELTGLFARHLQQGFKDNKEKVKLVASRKVEEFKDQYPNWKTMDLVKIGDHFEADYVIDLEIHSLTLYEPGSANQLFRGRAEISVQLVDVNEPDDDPLKQLYRCEYPKTRGPIPISEYSPLQFKQKFLDHVGRELSWYFTAHLNEDEYKRD